MKIIRFYFLSSVHRMNHNSEKAGDGNETEMENNMSVCRPCAGYCAGKKHVWLLSGS